MKLNPYNLLDKPFVYNTVQFLLGPGAKGIEAKVNREIFPPSLGLILDIGCGPRLRSPLPANGKIVGIDVNPDYVRSYTGGHLDTDPSVPLDPANPRSVYGYVCSAAELPFPDNYFDEARTRAVFHHFSNELARAVLQEMIRTLKPGGRLILMDPVLPRRPWLRPIGWLILRADRGQWMRTEEQLLEIARFVQPIGWNRYRYTVAYTGQEALILSWIKPQSCSGRNVGETG
jgi:SAM-dependent methyltransferase